MGKRISVAKRPRLFLSSGPMTEVHAPQENDSRLVGRQHLGSFESQRRTKNQWVKTFWSSGRLNFGASFSGLIFHLTVRAS